MPLLSLVTLTFDLNFILVRARDQTRFFGVNLAQIRSAVPEIFHTQPKKAQTDGAKNRTFRSSVRAVKMLEVFKVELGVLNWQI